MSQIWRDPGTVVQLWPELTDSPAVICHPEAEKHRSYYDKTVMCFKNAERTRHQDKCLFFSYTSHFTCVHLWWSLVMAWMSQIRVCRVKMHHIRLNLNLLH